MSTRLSDIDIKLLRIFCTIVECGGFTQAQSELNLSRSTVSTHMSNLETRLGFKLCNRGRAGFSLTAKGQHVYDASKKMLQSIGEYHTQIAQLKERIVGEITIGVLDNLITNNHFNLKLAINDILNVPEDLRIFLEISPPDKIEQKLLRGQLEMAILPQTKPRKEVSQKPLFIEKQLLYCGKEHPLFNMELSDITDDLISEQSYVRRGFVSDLIPYSSFFKNPAHAVSQQMEGLAHFILSGICIGFLPESYAKHWVKNGEMKIINAAQYQFDVPICLSRLEHPSYRPAAAYVYNSILQSHSAIRSH